MIPDAEGIMPLSEGVNDAYPNLVSFPALATFPGITPHILCIFPSESSISSWRYMNPPHSAMQGIPSDTFCLISDIMDPLRSSPSAWSSGYPPDRTIPSTSGRWGSLRGENLTISAPHLSSSSMLSSYVKQKTSSSANPILTFSDIGRTSGA